MKSFGFYLLSLALLATLASCGKNNESGKSSAYGNPYYTNQYGTISSPYAFNGLSVNQVIQANPCVTSGTPNQARVSVTLPVSLAPNILPANAIYVGVTSSGDVGVLAGNGTSQAQFVGYICQRGVTYTQVAQPSLVDLAYGSYSSCQFNPITRATLMLPGAYAPLYFRWLQGGSSLGQKFPFCQ